MIIMVDTETTGLEPVDSRIWQIGAIIVSDKWTWLDQFEATIIDEEIETQLQERKEALPNLPPIEHIKSVGDNPDKAWSRFSEFILSHGTPMYACAYNSKFDKKFILEESVGRGYSFLKGVNILNQLPWICAMEDVEANYKFKCWKLGHICLDHGIAVDPTKLHGALADISLTHTMVSKVTNGISELVDFKMEPWVVMRAITIEPWKDNGVSTAIAKDLGYRWEKTPAFPDKSFAKSWVKAVKRRHVEAEFKKAEGKLTIREIKE